MSRTHEPNRRAWDTRARERQRHTRTVAEAELREPLKAVDPENWLGGNIRGWRVLCLASGGGLQSALYASAGARVTVVDLSPEMLELDRQIAAKYGLEIKIVEASMDDLSALPNAGFELVIQPVSTCYVPDIAPVYREVARVLAPGGLYISQHKQPISLQCAAAFTGGGYAIKEAYYRTGPLPAAPEGLMHREAGTVEYLHRWEKLIGALCRSGFVLEDLVEPQHHDAHAAPGTYPHRCGFVPPYVKLKARRRPGSAESAEGVRLWTP